MNTVAESARDLPVVAARDVVVCGGGPAGVAAAIASARAGAGTTLIEAQGCLGGTWTAGCLGWMLDHENKAGILREILRRLEAVGGRAMHAGLGTNAFDVEKMKVVLESLCGESGVESRLHTLVAGAVRSGAVLTHVITESKSGREALAGRVFIDCTGDGDLAALAGCGFDLGHPETGATQPMSLLALVAGLDPDAARPFFRYGREVPGREPKERLRQAMERAGLVPSYAMPSLFWIRDDLFCLMANHEYGVLGTNAADLTRATLDARREVHALVDGLRRLGGIWRGLRIVATGAQIGVREGRRIHGRYTVSLEDIRRGARHADAACTVTFGIDVHSTEAAKGRAVEAAPADARPYDIPLRALIARDVDGLLMAGRCISGDFFAHASYRVTGNAVAMGESAGRLAAEAAAAGRPPHDLAGSEIRRG